MSDIQDVPDAVLKAWYMQTPPPQGGIGALSDDGLLSLYAKSQAQQNDVGFGEPSPWSGLEEKTPETAALKAAASYPNKGPGLQHGSDYSLESAASGVPIAGAWVPKTEALQSWESEHPWQARGMHALGGVVGTIPAMAAAPELFGAGAAQAFGTRVALGGASQGGLTTADSLVRGKDLGDALSDAKWPTILGAGIPAVAGAVGAGIRYLNSPAERYLSAPPQNVFGIEASKGQLSKDVQQLHREEGMRRGNAGPEAKDIMQTFDTQQKQAVADSAANMESNFAPSIQPGADRSSLGKFTQQGFETAQTQAKQAENAAWKDIGPLYASDAAKAVLPPYVQNEVGKAAVRVDPKLTPAADAMLRELDGYARGQPLRNEYGILGEQPPADMHMDDVRRRMLGLVNSAETGSADKKAASAIYRAFNEWSQDVATAPKGLKAGDPADVAKLVAARQVTKETRELFRTNDTSPAGKTLAKVFENDTTPEEVVSKLVGSGPGQTIPAGQVAALEQAKQILQKHGQGDAWDALRVAYWNNLTRGKTAALTDPGRISTNIGQALDKQRSVLDVLYTPAEQAKMLRYKQAIDTTTYKPPNASGTSYSIPQKPADGVLSGLVEHFTPAGWAGKLLRTVTIDPEAAATARLNRAGALAARDATGNGVIPIPHTERIARALQAQRSYGATPQMLAGALAQMQDQGRK